MNKMIPKIKSVRVMDDYHLFLQFENEEEKIFDMKPYLKYDIFMPLQDKNEFKDFYIDFGTVCWKCGANLSRDTFYIKGQAIDEQDIIMR